MLRRRLMIPPVAMALALGVALTAIGFWAGRTIVQVAIAYDPVPVAHQ